MRAIDLYYQIKPAILRSLQITMRRALAAQKRRTAKGTWPIDPAAGEPPLNWTGWPEGKKFALILHHDVDSPLGQEDHAQAGPAPGKMAYLSRKHDLKSIMSSPALLFTYSLGLPFLLVFSPVFGFETFMKHLIKSADHLGKLLALFHIDIIKQRYII